MRTIRLALSALVLAAGARAQDAVPPAQTIGRLSESAGTQLNQSMRELDLLRQQIAAEKLPLAQELGAAEEQLATLRRESTTLATRVDEGNLELATLKNELKSRQDELSYVGNLLDEYARSWDSKVHVCELQTCGTALEAARQAGQNQTLDLEQRQARQLEFARISFERLGQVVGGHRFRGQAVDLQGAVTLGQFAILGPIALFSANGGSVAGLALPQSGSSNPLVRPLEGALQRGLAAAVEGGDGLLPLDPSRGGALKALVQRTNIVHIFQKGGPIMWPLLAASILALGTVIERLFFLFRERLKRDSKALEQFFAAVERGDMQEAVRIGKDSRFFVARTLGYALEHQEGSLSGALLHAQSQEQKRFQRGIPILDTVITLAPLLGLLGTVTGMMGSFSLIGGELSSPGAITGGIAEALIATAFGLGIAITSLIPFNFLNARADEARHELESASAELQLILDPRRRAAQDEAPRESGRDLLQPVAPPAAESRRRVTGLELERQVVQRRMAELETERARQEQELELLAERERSLARELGQGTTGGR